MSAPPPAEWPAELAAELAERFGPLLTTERLSGVLSADAQPGGAWRARCAGGSAVVKGSDSAAEARFYAEAAPRLAGAGVDTPALYWSGAGGGLRWIAIEDIPLPFPRERWLADPEALAYLRRLHRATAGRPIALPGGYAPGWDDAMTERALDCWPTPLARELAPWLRHSQAAAQPLFEPRCSLSGDPNATNWGARRDGALVLFDWARFCAGTPALDVAITVPGFGDREAFALTAAAYLGADPPRDLAAFARQVELAKVWSVVEFLGTAAPSMSVPKFAQLSDSAAVWARTLA